MGFFDHLDPDSLWPNPEFGAETGLVTLIDDWRYKGEIAMTGNVKGQCLVY